MTPRDKHTISTLIEGVEYEGDVNSASAIHPYDTDVWRHLHTGSPSEVCPGITAPIAAECHDSGLEVFLLLGLGL
jgi:hypothetical protein